MTESFTKFRQQGIGGSDIATILDVNPFAKSSTKRDIYERIANKHDVSFEPTLPMQLGTWLEPYVIAYYEENNGVDIERGTRLVHPQNKFMIGNLDGLNKAKIRLLEVKTSQKDVGWKEPGTDNIPAHYLCQVAWYSMIYGAITKQKEIEVEILFLKIRLEDVFKIFLPHQLKKVTTDREVLKIAAKMDKEITNYIRENPPVIYKYRTNKKIENGIYNKVMRFWEDHIDAKCMPEPTKVSDIAQYYKPRAGATLKADDHAIKLYQELKSLAHYGKRLKDIKEELKIHMKDNETLINDEGKVIVTYEGGIKRAVSPELLRKAGVYEEFVESKVSRTLRIK